MRDLDFDADGAALHDGAACSILGDLEAALVEVPPDRAGTRIQGIPALGALLTSDPIREVAAGRLGEASRPVRAILLDKTPARNWGLGWHQDRTIVVREKRDTSGFGPWTTKASLQHVEPPFSIIEAMVTLRIHLDDVPANNAPLLIAAGSHRFGRITERDVDAAVAKCGTRTCLARRGDIWMYATPILHASAVSTGSSHRRVVQVDFSAAALPNGLDWLGL